eukprot:gene13317-15657_t
MIFSEYQFDPRDVGEVYLVTHEYKDAPGWRPKFKHYSVIIDLAGESSQHMIVGAQVHLAFVDEQRDQHTYAQNRIEAPISSFDSITRLGFITNSMSVGDPQGWFVVLLGVGIAFYKHFSDVNGSQWSQNKSDSRLFAKFYVEKLRSLSPDEWTIEWNDPYHPDEDQEESEEEKEEKNEKLSNLQGYQDDINNNNNNKVNIHQ